MKISSAIKFNDLEEVKFLINQNDEKIDYKKEIRLAIKCGFFNIVKYLVEKNKSIIDYKEELIAYADKRKQIEIAKYLK